MQEIIEEYENVLKELKSLIRDNPELEHIHSDEIDRVSSKIESMRGEV